MKVLVSGRVSTSRETVEREEDRWLSDLGEEQQRWPVLSRDVVAIETNKPCSNTLWLMKLTGLFVHCYIKDEETRWRF